MFFFFFWLFPKLTFWLTGPIAVTVPVKHNKDTTKLSRETQHCCPDPVKVKTRITKSCYLQERFCFCKRLVFLLLVEWVIVQMKFIDATTKFILVVVLLFGSFGSKCFIFYIVYQSMLIIFSYIPFVFAYMLYRLGTPVIGSSEHVKQGLNAPFWLFLIVYFSPSCSSCIEMLQKDKP